MKEASSVLQTRQTAFNLSIFSAFETSSIIGKNGFLSKVVIRPATMTTFPFDAISSEKSTISEN